MPTKTLMKFSVVARSKGGMVEDFRTMAELQQSLGLTWLHIHEDGTPNWTVFLSDYRFDTGICNSIKFLWDILIQGHSTELPIIEEWEAHIIDDSLYPIVGVNLDPCHLIDEHGKQGRLFGYRFSVVNRGMTDTYDANRMTDLRRAGLHYVHGEFSPSYEENVLILTDMDVNLSDEDADRLIKIRGMVDSGRIPSNVLSHRRDSNRNLIIELA